MTSPSPAPARPNGAIHTSHLGPGCVVGLKGIAHLHMLATRLFDAGELRCEPTAQVARKASTDIWLY